MSYFPENFQIRTTMRKHRKLNRNQENNRLRHGGRECQDGGSDSDLDVSHWRGTVESPC